VDVDWIPLLRFPLDWAALALVVVSCLYWERAGATGLGVEGALATAMIGFIAGYDATGSYAAASGIAAGATVAYAVLTGARLRLLRADPADGSFVASLTAACALALRSRHGQPALLTESPPPGLLRGTGFDGTYAEDLIANPWLLSAPILVAIAAWTHWRTPFGLRLRAFGETPALRLPGASAARTRILGLVVGALFVVPAAGLLLRSSGGTPPVAFGILALACAIAGRWAFAPALLLSVGPALLLTVRPYAGSAGSGGAALDMAPFLLALLYLVVLSRRSLRLAAGPQARVDPDTL
jgi:simple sugar transport system permease protein